MIPYPLDPRSHYRVEDEFFTLDTVKWATTDDGATGTNLANDAAGGECSIVTAGADNDYHVMSTTKKAFLFAAGKPVWFYARFSLTEANTDDSNIILGLTSVLTSGNLQNDGAGPATNHIGAVFYKVDGTMTIKFQVSNGTTQSSQDLVTFTSGSVYEVGFHADCDFDGTNVLVTPWVNNVTSGTRTQGTPTKTALSGQAAKYLVYGVKAGGANVETLKMQRIECVQVR